MEQLTEVAITTLLRTIDENTCNNCVVINGDLPEWLLNAAREYCLAKGIHLQQV